LNWAGKLPRLSLALPASVEGSAEKQPGTQGHVMPQGIHGTMSIKNCKHLPMIQTFPWSKGLSGDNGRNW